MERDLGKPLFDLVLLIASAAAFVHASALPNIDIVGDLSPAFFPQLISAAVFVLATPCFINDLREWRSTARGDHPVGHRRAVAQWLLVVALTLGYTLVFERLGYIPSTAVFTFCCVVGFTVTSGGLSALSMGGKVKALAAAALFAVVLASSVYYVFTELFDIPLPG
ncbi:tripartite tricarboxylate transporter TctB family protein [Larsenimonas suaedae]|uniref:Tripartite tricarboxylate transporter TctB family protein n=1 Tax=Larsenimonas suaedae TaxID=1851019 RepID=A0ABU1GSH2_9GAMM|nr:tripartite tricarboxylate transporter TctB family protein [Larsenimonas suaedae]MCM2972221.1 tripartite tricarboxylate transporter TctB family protein [Larsenimonas suaedae]MDR5894983.1 tripartite tricarboxylate transporter TctB family protein [Larsenimonas suaedae]